MISEFNKIDSIYPCSDMIWYPSKTLPLYFYPFCDNQLKTVREYATICPHLNLNKTNDNTVESENENNDDTVESKGKSNIDTIESASYNVPCKSKNDFLCHPNQHSIVCNRKMKHRYHYWLWCFIWHPCLSNIIFIINILK